MSCRGLAAMAAIGLLLVSVGRLGATESNVQAPTATIEEFVHTQRAKVCGTSDVQARASTIQPVRISGDSGAEFIVQPRDNCLCAPTGNCKVWVLAPEKNGFRVLLTGSRVQDFRVLSTVGRGHPDLELSAHDSATESIHWRYHFDGVRYRKSTCAIWRYADRNDPERVLDTPQISNCSG
jgi:hypothetical protein